MKTLRKIGIVTLASSLALGSALASPVAESIATFGTWGLWILGIMIGVEVIKTIANHTKVGAGAVEGAGKLSSTTGDWLARRAKKIMAESVRVEGEAAAEYKWLKVLNDDINAVKDLNTLKSAINKAKTDLRKEEREERYFMRRIEKLLRDTDEFTKKIPGSAAIIAPMTKTIRVYNQTLIKNMARGGEFEKEMAKEMGKGKSFSTWKAKHDKLVDILSESVSADRGIVAEAKNIEKATIELKNR
ncbi:MAG: hypothetical protein AABX04_06110 [Nanoarchaeota archaeon]